MTKQYKLFLTLIIAVLLLPALHAQSKASLTGVVKDAVSGEELIGASVFIKETSQGAVTDLDGLYRINSIPAGTYSVEISYLGYNPIELTLSVEAGQVLEQNVDLSYQGVTVAEVTVTAQAEGQIASINQQLADRTIKNIVSAKKIQEVPNSNAAEAIGRVPGVSIVRSGGEGSKVVVRGMAPKFNKVQVEGITMASTDGSNRSTDLSMISPYMLDGIEVSKAAMPDQEADAIGGVVNFILRQAPDSMAFDVLLQGGYGSLNNSLNNYKLVIGGSNRFANNKLGVFAQIDLERRNRNSNDVSVNYVNRTNQADDFPISLGAMSVADINRDIQRAGATVVLDYKLPNGGFKMINFFSLINNDQVRRYEQYNPFFSTHTYGLSQTENDIRVMTNALKYHTNIGAFRLDMGAFFSKSVNEQPLNTNFITTESNAFEPEAATTDKPDDIQFYSRNNIEAANVQFISSTPFDTEEEVLGGDINFTYDLNLSSNLNIQLKAGGKYKKLDKFFDQESARIPVAQAGHGRPFVQSAIANLPFLGDNLGADATDVPLSLFVDKEYGTNTFPGGDFFIQNVPDVTRVNQFLDHAEIFYFKDYILSTRDDYTGSEEYKATYLMAIIDIGRKMTFIPGVRYENNVTSYTAKRGDNTIQDWEVGYFHHDTTITRSNTFILPMVHLKYKPTSWFDVRLAYTHTLARPDFNQIIPKWDISLGSVAFNNPFLEPSLSKNVDVYLSAYKSKLGLLTVGGFYKNIESLVYAAGLSAVKQEDIDLHELPVNIGTPFSRVINNKNAGQLYGLEVEWQTRFWYMDNFLRGLVLTANYTRTFSSVDYERTVLKQVPIPEFPFLETVEITEPYNERLLFQPTDIFNLTLGYDYKKTTARVSFVYQNDIFSNPNFFSLLRGATDDYFRIDFSLTQKLPWEGFQAILNFSNLTSENEQDSLLSNGSPIRIQYYGSTLDVGIRYRLR